MVQGTRPAQTIVVAGVFTALGTLFVALRLWTRLVIIRSPGYEDAILAFSWVRSNLGLVTIAPSLTHVFSCA